MKSQILWLPYDRAAVGLRPVLIADEVRGFVAFMSNGLIHNVPGTRHDWQHGEIPTHYAEMPELKELTGVSNAEQ